MRQISWVILFSFVSGCGMSNTSGELNSTSTCNATRVAEDPASALPVVVAEKHTFAGPLNENTWVDADSNTLGVRSNVTGTPDHKIVWRRGNKAFEYSEKGKLVCRGIFP